MSFTIATAKELTASPRPLYLREVTLSDGTVWRFATDAVTYGGNAYLPRVLNDSVNPGILGEQGIDIQTSMALELADADYYLWTNIEGSGRGGFKGSNLLVRFVMHDLATGDFSTDSYITFQGQCKEPGGGKMPAWQDGKIRVGFGSLLALGDIQHPRIRIQPSCPFFFPATAPERYSAAYDANSKFFYCGYSHDAGGGEARGTAGFTTCNYTKADCKARGMYSVDASARLTGSFGGDVWNPERSITVRSYGGQRESLINEPNIARYGNGWPQLMGTAYTQPVVLTTAPDGNFLKLEAFVCEGALDTILLVIVNDVTIPHTFDDTLGASLAYPGVYDKTAAFKGGWWKTSNNGSRRGLPTNDAGFNDGAGIPQGDPHGSKCVIEIVVPRKLADVGSNPNIRILATRGTKVTTTQIKGLLDRYLPDVQQLAGTFTAQASVDSTSITYTDQFGGSSTRPQFQTSLYLSGQKPQPLADILRGLKTSARKILGLGLDGKLYIATEQTLADQQPAAVTGSNYNTPIASHHQDGTTGNGYAAYKFDATNIEGIPSLSMLTSGNAASIGFEDEANQYVVDNFNPIDSDDLRRIGRDIGGGTFAPSGVTSFDQLARLFASDFAKKNRGNPDGSTSTKGTIQFEFTTTFRAVHLRAGDLVVIDWQLAGISSQLFRIRSIAPDSNYEKAKIAVTWHEDSWYYTAYGQQPASEFQPDALARTQRPPYPWGPAYTHPTTGDPVFDRSDKNFLMQAIYDPGADSSFKARIAVTGFRPVNQPAASPAAPFVPLQGTTASTGGTIIGGRTYYFQVSAKDSGGKVSAMSTLVLVGVPAGTNTNTVTVNGIQWGAGSVGYVIWGGADTNTPVKQFEAAGTPASITLTDLKVADVIGPDPQTDSILFRAYKVEHSGPWAGGVLAVTSSTVQVSVNGGGFTVNQWAGYDFTFLGSLATGNPLLIYNANIVSNTSDTLTLSGSSPSPVGIVSVGDLISIYSKPTYGTDGTGQYVDDANWVNVTYPGFIAGDSVGLVMHFIAGTLKGQSVYVDANTTTKLYGKFPFPPDATSRFIIMHSLESTSVSSRSIRNNDSASILSAEVEVPNESGAVWLVKAFTLSTDGKESSDAHSPERMIYLYGARAVADYWQNIAGAATITPDVSLASAAQIALDRPSTTINMPSPLPVDGAEFTYRIVQDATGGRAMTLHTDYIDGAAYPPISTALADSTYTWKMKNGKAVLKSVRNGVAAGAGTFGPYVPVTGAASITLDLTTGSLFAIPLDRATTGIAVTGGVSGQRWGIKATLDGTAGRAVAWNSGFATGLVAPPASVQINQSPNGVTFIKFIVNDSGVSECESVSVKF